MNLMFKVHIILHNDSPDRRTVSAQGCYCLSLAIIADYAVACSFIVLLRFFLKNIISGVACVSFMQVNKESQATLYHDDISSYLFSAFIIKCILRYIPSKKSTYFIYNLFEISRILLYDKYNNIQIWEKTHKITSWFYRKSK